MGYSLENIKRIRYAIESSGQYALSKLDSIASYYDIKVTEASVELNGEQLENAAMMQRVDKYLPKINSRRRANVSLTTYLNGSSTAITGAASVTTGENPPYDLLYTVMGGSRTTPGTNLIAAGGALAYGRFKFDSSDFVAGDVFGMRDSNGRLECLRVDRTDGGQNVTASCGFSFTPASGSQVYGATTAYLIQDPDTSLQFFVEGQDVGDKWLPMGLQGGFSIATPIGELPTVSFDFQNGANWISGSAIADELAQADYDDAVPPPFVDGIVYVATRYSGSQFGVQMAKIDVQSIELTPNITYLDVTSEMGVNNIVRKRRGRSVPALSGKMVVYVGDDIANLGSDYAWWNIKDGFTGTISSYNTQYIGLGVQIGNQPGNTVFIYMPQLQITNVQRVDAGELAGLEVSFEALEDDFSDPSISADLAKSAFSISFL